jgi:peptidoglycan-associated lipoprotein
LLASCGGKISDDVISNDPSDNSFFQSFKTPGDKYNSYSKSVPLNGTIHFAYDSSRLSSDDRRILQNIVSGLLKKTKTRIRIAGHCDVRGTQAYNLALGDRRAHAVKRFMVNAGIDPDRIRTISYGEEKPIAYGRGEKAHAQNRRAEIKPF